MILYMKKTESIVVVGVLFVLVVSFMIFSLVTNTNPNTTPVSGNRSLTLESVTGKYIANSDKTAYLYLNDEGTYLLNINVCQGYLELSGIYELRNDKLVLINKNKYPDYENLIDNDEIFLSKIDDVFILNEDLVCTPQETSFKKVIE